MTALNWVHLNDEWVAIASDSQVSEAEGEERGRARSYCTKVFPLPHLNSVVCGTGNIELILAWLVTIETTMIAQDIGTLVRVAAEQLPKLAVNHKGETTIYHFGFGPDGTLYAFAHRSTDNFRPERLPKGFGIKPPSDELCAAFPNMVAESGLAAAFVELTHRQRELDRTGDPEKRVGVGGEVHLFTMAKNNQSLWTCHRFEDFDTEYERVLQWADTESSTKE